MTDTWIPFNGRVASEKDGVLELVPHDDDFVSMYINESDTKRDENGIFVLVGGHFLKIDIKPGSSYPT